MRDAELQALLALITRLPANDNARPSTYDEYLTIIQRPDCPRALWLEEDAADRIFEEMRQWNEVCQRERAKLNWDLLA